MRTSRPWGAVVFAALGSGLLAGCFYYNTLYNAEDLYRQAETLRLGGQDSGLRVQYREVVEKANRGYQADEEGGRADQALLLIGKAHFRLGEITEARQALERVLEISEDSDVRAQAALYRGVVAVAVGETARGIALLDDALEDLTEPTDRAEGHFWRARAFFARGMVEQGWRDLDQAGEASGAYFVEANLERVTWGFKLPDLTRIHQGIQALIFTSRAQAYGDSVRSLAVRFSDRWGSVSAGVLLDNAEDAHWSRAERDRLVMTRAWFAYESGDMVRAEEDANLVGSGAGEQAAAARVTIARWRLVEVEEVDHLERLRAVLLPAVTYGEAQVLLNAMRRVQLLTEYGLEDEPVALIGAAEISRDVLGAGRLSASLFETYAAAQPQGPWVGKALLASRALMTDPAERSELDERLRALPEDPYVRYAHDDYSGPELGALEPMLQGALDRLLQRADEELTARRLLAGVPNE